MKKIALITGITGQDGSYLAELLLKKNYQVHGIVRRVASDREAVRFSRINHIVKKINLHSASLESYASIVKVIQKIKPIELYHLAAQSYVHYSFEDEFSTLNTNINGTHYILSAIRDFSPKTKFYFAGSSEMFGKVSNNKQNEDTKFYPRSPYGISKLTGFDLTRNYRESYKIFASTGILFNHESPRRGFEFVTRKISHAVASIKLGLQKDLVLGNLDAKRDWGHAKDYVEAMWMMLQQKKSEDFVIGTGKMYTVRDFVKIAFLHVGLDYKKYVKTNKKFLRPADVEKLCADFSKSKQKLNWSPKINFRTLVIDMVESDIKLLRSIK
jgi:GDPmannose 4,6-dehydratase